MLRILTQKCSPWKNSLQITANAKIHGRRKNSRLPWIPWICDFRLALVMAAGSNLLHLNFFHNLYISKTFSVNRYKFVADATSL